MKNIILFYISLLCAVSLCSCNSYESISYGSYSGKIITDTLITLNIFAKVPNYSTRELAIDGIKIGNLNKKEHISLNISPQELVISSRNPAISNDILVTRDDLIVRSANGKEVNLVVDKENEFSFESSNKNFIKKSKPAIEDISSERDFKKQILTPLGKIKGDNKIDNGVLSFEESDGDNLILCLRLNDRKKNNLVSTIEIVKLSIENSAIENSYLHYEIIDERDYADVNFIKNANTLTRIGLISAGSGSIVAGIGTSIFFVIYAATADPEAMKLFFKLAGYLFDEAKLYSPKYVNANYSKEIRFIIPIEEMESVSNVLHNIKKDKNKNKAITFELIGSTNYKIELPKNSKFINQFEIARKLYEK